MSMISIVNSIHTYPYAQRSLYYKKNRERHPAFCGRLFAGSCTPRHCTELDTRPRFQARRHPWICICIDQKVALLFSPFEIKTTQAGIGPYKGFWTPKSFGSLIGEPKLVFHFVDGHPRCGLRLAVVPACDGTPEARP